MAGRGVVQQAESERMHTLTLVEVGTSHIFHMVWLFPRAGCVTAPHGLNLAGGVHASAHMYGLFVCMWALLHGSGWARAHVWQVIYAVRHGLHAGYPRLARLQSSFFVCFQILDAWQLCELWQQLPYAGEDLCLCGRLLYVSKGGMHRHLSVHHKADSSALTQVMDLRFAPS
jgi:hypothetical protein